MLSSRRILHAARIMAGLTRAQLAKAAGIGEPALAEIERGTADPRNSTLIKLAKALANHGVQMVGLSKGVLGGALLLERQIDLLDDSANMPSDGELDELSGDREVSDLGSETRKRP